MIAFHNSHDLSFRAPFGAVPTGTEITLALLLREAAPGYSCLLRLWWDPLGEQLCEMQPSEQPDGTLRFACTITAPDTPGLLWYSFRILAPDGSVQYYGNRDDALGGIGQCCGHLPPSYQITVYHPAPVPEWYKQAVVYQIFPDRFARGADWQERFFAAAHPDSWKGARRVLQFNWNDKPFYTRDGAGNVTRWPFFGGTLEGIREKLPYLQELGVTAIYLNPIFEAYSNHKYDTANYLAVDPGFGDEAGFRRLASEARERGIRLILDGVFNHTGADSVYFNRYGNYSAPGACQGEESPYYSWFRFTDFPEEYESWWGVKDLPNIDETNASYQDYIYRAQDSVVRHWLRCGASGWRLDVADELPDSFIEELRAAIKQEDPDALLLGEVWEDASNKESYGQMRRYLLGSELDATMHYPFRTALLDFFLGRIPAQTVCDRMMSLLENYPPENYYAALNLIGSHDRMRALTALGGAREDMTEQEQEHFTLSPEARALALQRLKALTCVQFTAAGVPCIYYGDEAGVEGCSDPFNRAPYPWGQEDKQLQAHYKALIALRKAYPALVSGSFRPLSFGEDIYGCLRQDAQQTLVCLVNRSSEPRTAQLPLHKSVRHLFGRHCIYACGEELTAQLPPLGFCIAELK